MPSNLLPHGAGILGTSPTLVIRDERASWPEPKGSRLEPALLTGSLKRSGKGLVISTRAANDPHPFSRRLDEDPPSTYRQEHRRSGLKRSPGSFLIAPHPPKSPQTNGMVERWGGRIEEVLQSHHFRSGEELETTLHRYVWLSNQQLPQSALGSKPPLEAMKDWRNLRPDLFRKRPYDLPGCDS